MRSLRSRLALLFGAGTSLVLLLALSLLYVALDRQLDGAVDADLSGRSDDLIAGVRAHDLTVVPGDPMAQLYAADGTPVATSLAIAGRLLLDPVQVQAVRRDTTTTRTLPLGTAGAQVRVRLLSRPVGSQVLTVAQPLDAVERAGSRQLVVLAVATPVLIAALVALCWLLLRAALRPVDLLTREAAAISTLDTGRRLPHIAGDDEIARLAATLDSMLTRLSVAFERERAFVDDASHELRTPITVLRGELELALGAVDNPADVRVSLLAAQAQAARLGLLAEDLLLLARERAGSLVVQREPVDLTDLTRTEARALAKVTSLTIDVQGDPVIIEADPGRLRQVLTNLAVNSATAGATAARVTIGADQEAAHWEWADNGPGFPPALLATAFERFVRGDASRTPPTESTPPTGKTAPADSALSVGSTPATGAGLGLSIVRAVVIAHGGTAQLSNGAPLGGAVVTVGLPLD